MEDLRLAVDELCLPFLDPREGQEGRLLLRYGWEGGTIEISCTRTAGPETVWVDALVRDELSAQILDALVDEHGVTASDGQSRAWLKMHRPRPDEG